MFHHRCVSVWLSKATRVVDLSDNFRSVGLLAFGNSLDEISSSMNHLLFLSFFMKRLSLNVVYKFIALYYMDYLWNYHDHRHGVFMGCETHRNICESQRFQHWHGRMCFPTSIRYKKVLLIWLFSNSRTRSYSSLDCCFLYKRIPPLCCNLWLIIIDFCWTIYDYYSILQSMLQPS